MLIEYDVRPTHAMTAAGLNFLQQSELARFLLSTYAVGLRWSERRD